MPHRRRSNQRFSYPSFTAHTSLKPPPNPTLIVVVVPLGLMWGTYSYLPDFFLVRGSCKKMLQAVCTARSSTAGASICVVWLPRVRGKDRLIPASQPLRWRFRKTLMLLRYRFTRYIKNTPFFLRPRHHSGQGLTYGSDLTVPDTRGECRSVWR